SADVPVRRLGGKDAEGVVGKNTLPHIGVPLVLAKVDPEGGPGRVDGRWGDNLPAPGEAVDQLGQAEPVTLQAVLGQPRVVQVGDGKITAELLLPWRGLVQVRPDEL